MTTVPDPSATSGDEPIVAHLGPWVAAGVLADTDVSVTAALCQLANEDTPLVWLTTALALRGPAHGHVAVDPTRIRQQVLTQVEHQGHSDLAAVKQLDWPSDPETWLATVARSPLAPELIAVERGLIYLRRSLDQERRVAGWFHSRLSSAERPNSLPSEANLDAIKEALGLTDEQQAAVAGVLRSPVAVLTGGPGMGKTTTVTAILAAVADQASTEHHRVALAAPTGRAAARLGESIHRTAAALTERDPAGRGTGLSHFLHDAHPSTIHSLLGSTRDGTFRHHRDRPLPFDTVIIDETSMVSLELMDSLLAAIGPDTHLILVGDAHQLPSIDAGSVLGDLAAAARVPGSPLSGLVHQLTTSFRFPAESRLGRLAAAVNGGDADQAWAVLAEDQPNSTAGDQGDVRVSFSEESALAAQTIIDTAEAIWEAAVEGDADAALRASESSRVICAQNRGPTGVDYWNELGQSVVARHNPTGGWWQVGRPVMITANDHPNRIVNGDHGVVVADPDGTRMVALRAGGETVRLLSPSRLPNTTTMHAITIHKSQGSEFDHVVVVLPPADSPLATRQLLYTAITRARVSLHLIGSEQALRGAVSHDTERHSGLLARLTDPADHFAGQSLDLGNDQTAVGPIANGPAQLP